MKRICLLVFLPMALFAVNSAEGHNVKVSRKPFVAKSRVVSSSRVLKNALTPGIPGASGYKKSAVNPPQPPPKDGFAGPDQMVSEGHKAVIGPPVLTDKKEIEKEAEYCYQWFAGVYTNKTKDGDWVDYSALIDPSLALPSEIDPHNPKMKDRRISVAPLVSYGQVVTYRVRRTHVTNRPETETREQATTYDDVNVYTLNIFRFCNTTDKAWKIVVGDRIQHEVRAMPGCTNWEWKVGDGKHWTLDGGTDGNGKPLPITPTGDNMVIPYSDLAKAAADADPKDNWFGDVKIVISCTDRYGTKHTLSKDIQVFFEPGLSLAGKAPTSDVDRPCWFVFWKKYAVVEGLEFCTYQFHVPTGAATVELAHYNDAIDKIVLYDESVNVNAPWTGKKGSDGNEFTVGGTGKGIVCLSEVLAHELYHQKIHKVWRLKSPHGDSDEIPDGEENNPTEVDGNGNKLFWPTLPGNPDTNDLQYDTGLYSDAELRCRIIEMKKPQVINWPRNWAVDKYQENTNSNWNK